MTLTDDTALGDRTRGALLELSVGDAPGTTIEFKSKDSYSRSRTSWGRAVAAEGRRVDG